MDVKNFFSNLLKQKRTGRALACFLAGFMTLGVVLPVAAACEDETDTGSGSGSGNEQTYDPETRPLVMSLGTPDGVFNPFFSTSAYDGTVVGMTQISMLSADKNGVVTYGDNEPVVVKDYQETYDSVADETTYKFILKNGI